MFATNDVNAQALEVIWRTDGYKLGTASSTRAVLPLYIPT